MQTHRRQDKREQNASFNINQSWMQTKIQGAQTKISQKTTKQSIKITRLNKVQQELNKDQIQKCKVRYQKSKTYQWGGHRKHHRESHKTN